MARIVSSQTVTESDYKIPNRFYTDNDLDFVFDYLEDTISEVNLGDTDNDGNANYLDVDDDGDTWLTVDEGTGDDDKDGVPNYLDIPLFIPNPSVVFLFLPKANKIL
ncbi:hypothetical protein OS188_11360 [Xanthomarina sp. F1114]|uniref:hypothetical protein n=1 Tax=Xanthomarina sp. F1114 TaxID=2996019 RepID=UPI00225E3208|nr:hypothetical protein [Xanthomarina sp. F1114]MCX7548549.1 hypothetical protein [Xanthomarina sp. F1114]